MVQLVSEKRVVLVCGGRDYSDLGQVFGVLDALHAARPITSIVHGDAPGADQLGGAWGRSREVHVTACPADWSRHGRSAGPIRNARMLSVYAPALVVAFAGGRGTADMVRQSKRCGVEVVEVAPR